MKKLFFVIGPESSGNRLLTRILCNSGCFGDFEHYQRLDEFINGKQFLKEIIGDNETIVFRRSVPHGGVFPNIKLIVEKFVNEGFTPHFVLPQRSTYELYRSKINNNGKRSLEDAHESNKLELFHIWTSVFPNLQNPFMFVPTSLLFYCPNLVLIDLKFWSGLDIPIEKVKSFIYNADEKYHK